MFAMKFLYQRKGGSYIADSSINFNPSLSRALENLRLRDTGCLGTGMGKKYSPSRDSDEHYVFHTVSPSTHITLLHFTQSHSLRGLARDSPSPKTLFTYLPYCSFIAMQSDPHILATLRSSSVRKWCTKVNIPLAGGRTSTSGFSYFEGTTFQDEINNFARGM
jgi:hypothetical protein